MVCSGMGCNVTFTNVSFDRCTVVAVAGATVTLTSCSLSLDGCCLGLLASGAGTTVRMGADGGKGCTFNQGYQGVSVQAGAYLHACNVTVANACVAGIEVTGAGSKLELSDSHVRKFPPLSNTFPTHSDTSNVAVAVRDGSTARVTNVSIQKVGCGVEVGNSSAQLSECCIENMHGGSCIEFEVNKSGFAAERSCTVHGCTLVHSKYAGIFVSGAHGDVDVRDCTLHSHAYAGLCVTGKATVTAMRCRAWGSKEAGYIAEDQGSSMTLTDCESTGDDRGRLADGRGCFAKQGGRVAALRVKVSDSTSSAVVAWKQGCVEMAECIVIGGKECGVIASEGGHANMTKCKVTSSSLQGVWVTGKSSNATLTDCIVEHAGQSCMHVQGGGSVMMTRCDVKHGVEDGIVVLQKGSKVEAKECSFIDNGHCGVFASESASLVATDCKSSGSRWAGFFANKKAKVSLKNCSSDEDCRGCACDNGEVVCQGMTVSGSTELGFQVWGGGKFDLNGCEAHACGDHACWTGGTQYRSPEVKTTLKMTDCVMSDTKLDCVAVVKGATAVLKRCEMTGSAEGNGLLVKNDGTQVEADSCRLEGNAKNGVAAVCRSKLTGRVCHSSRNKLPGFSAWPNCTVLLVGCTSDGKLVYWPFITPRGKIRDEGE